jgi:copper chaperone NosL
MRKFFYFLLAGLIVGVGAVRAFSRDDLKTHPECPHCGMNREQYAQSRMLIRYVGGKETGTCSLHCTAGEMTVNRDKIQEEILVADYYSRA